MTKKTLIIIFITGSLLMAENLITNGDFESPLNTGWVQDSYGSYITVNRATNYDPDPDYEVYAEKGPGSGYINLYQCVDIPSTDLDFSISAKLYAYDNNADTLCWAGSAVIIRYLNDLGTLLGETRICYFTTPCPWQNSSTTHLIIVNDSMWHNYAFNIDSELTNLPGINPGDIQKIEVALYDTTAHTC